MIFNQQGLKYGHVFLFTSELSVKSSKIEYMYPQCCISFATVFRWETPPSDMTTKLQGFLFQGRGMGE
jgi:hypothetical protein